ncbi:gametocyte-specific factor 1 homolog [Drosophila willistoni]|nr:gametocyte-specific factor 1 homolog [Drosophila willistoni]
MSFNDFVTCPLNKSHRLLRGRLDTHLVRCCRALDTQQKKKIVICPFNETHSVSAAKLLDHIKNKCTSNVSNFVNDMKELEEPKPSLKGVDNVPPKTAECEDDWDLEPDVGTYKPLHNCDDKLVVRSMKGQSRAVRQDFIYNERCRFAELKDK